MTFTYDDDLQRDAIDADRREYHAELKTGLYAGLKGPSMETPAEITYLKTIGADAVGFSTVMEVIAAYQAKMRVFGISAITNSHVPGKRTSAHINDIIAAAQACAPKVAVAVKGVLGALSFKP